MARYRIDLLAKETSDVTCPYVIESMIFSSVNMFMVYRALDRMVKALFDNYTILTFKEKQLGGTEIEVRFEILGLNNGKIGILRYGIYEFPIRKE